MKKTLLVLVALALFSAPCWSHGTEMSSDKPSMSTSQTVKLTALIEAINHETREVTLRGPEGNSVSFVASEDAPNFEAVKAGDQVMVEYEQSMTIEVFPNDGSEPGAGEMVVESQSGDDESPALTAIDALVVSAVVEEINLEANTFKLRGPSGEIKEYEARDPENLKKAEVGDIVVVTFTDAIALTLLKTAEE